MIMLCKFVTTYDGYFCVAVAFCNGEESWLLIMRLEVLTGSKCEDIALKLARICMRCLKLPGSSLYQDCPQETKNQLIDFYIALLFKFKLIDEIVNEVSESNAFGSILFFYLHFFLVNCSRCYKT